MFYNKIYQGDCKDVLLKIPESSVDLVYLDPPFFANRQSEVIWNDGSEEALFKERRKGGILTFVAWMKLRMYLIRKVLKDTGSVYLHCDYRAVHYLRQMMDEVFEDNFRNDIIWGFRTGGAGGREYAKKHNNLLFYTKTKKYYFKPEEDLYYLLYPEKPAHRYFIAYPGLTENFDRDNVKMPEGMYRKATHLRDVWDDEEVKPLWNMGYTSKERMSVKGKFTKTQKPENLLKRIITASSREGQVVLDPFCGSGTTIAAAQKLNRKWIGIDVSPTACKIMQKRMDSIGIKSSIEFAMPEALKSSAIDRRKLGFDWQDWICDELEWIGTKHTGDGGVDGIYYNSKNEECFGQVKLNRAGRPELQKFVGALTSKRSKEGTFVADSFADRTVYAENERLKSQGYNITLLTKDEIFDMINTKLKEKAKKLESARKKFR